jgi:hypothetical protein
MKTASGRALALLGASLVVAGCGFALDVSRVRGLHADFDLVRPAEESIPIECRLNVPPGAVDALATPIRLTRELEFRGQVRRISIDVDTRIVEASRTIGRERCVLTSGFRVEDFYEAVVFDPAEEPFFDSLLGELRRVRAEIGLDDSGYADLLAVFVQSLDYRAGASMPKHPIAAFADGEGDCDERSALLAGLLAREGYDVCLMLFADEGHMAIGLRAADIGYLGTGYAYVETTAPSYIGYNPWGAHGPTPRLIGIGDGDKIYVPDARQRYVARVVRVAAGITDGWDDASGPVERLAQLAAVQFIAMTEGDLDEACAAIRGLFEWP